MSGIKKYGAFAGVYTPSLLTILGVIMYMRLGWVVGQAGLIYTLIIILISHVISVTTGLSISSIATDKKIKTGGIYYILSRSLGLPMGGAIGIALFIGTALSISLYIVGFSESFLNIPAIQDFLHLQPDIHGYRMVGTAIIIILVIIAFISTSLAIKTQFFILLAIALSLVSIVVGFFVSDSYHPEHIALFSNGEVSIETVFAIFFPAVTGFTAGVAMSGDLKDPKKDIPKGTIFAIITGLIVYVSLAVGIAFFIDKKYLISDYNILSKIAWFAPLVIAGIWGATLSSALGGILGGPRILQAMSNDSITPKIFGKGYGSSNEPRNALLLIFAIAEGGILIGKLDVIAGVVSMFYLASYGFINLAYVLEKWASTDFRPSFKVHISIGIIGFVASFAVMFKLDMIAMIVSLIVIAAIYFYLKHKELKTETGDVWHSVWSSITRRALTVMSNKDIEERNWKPNIILFSGGTNQRPHLLEIGKAIVGRHGILSNFDLIENKESELLFTKTEQRIKDEEKIPGVFTRRQTCRDIYEGIEMIARTYGFSGVEPNTIMMGWSRQSKNPEKFVKLINTLNKLDYNILMLDYDKRFGFGKKQQIDIWWRGAGNHGNLALTITKFLLTNPEWSNAVIRLLIVNYENDKASLIRKKAEMILHNLRIDAYVKIINNEIEQKPFYDLMRVESKNADLIILGFPEIKQGKEQEFIDKTNALLKDIGTVMLIKASSVFKELNLGVSFNAPKKEQNILSVIENKNEINKLETVKNAHIEFEINNIFEKTTSIYNEFLRSFVLKQINDNIEFVNESNNISKQIIDNINLGLNKFEDKRKFKLVIQNRSNLLVKLTKHIGAYLEKIGEQKEIFDIELKKLVDNTANIFEKEIPKKVIIRYTKDELKINKNDSFELRLFKFGKKIFAGKNGASYKVKLLDLFKQEFIPKNYLFLYNHMKNIGLVNAQFIIEYQKLLNKTDEELKYTLLHIESNKFENINIASVSEKIDDLTAKLLSFNNKVKDDLLSDYLSFYTNHFNSLIKKVNDIDCNRHIKEHKSYKKIINKTKAKLFLVPEKWAKNQKLLYNATSFELKLLSISSIVKTTLKNSVANLETSTKENILSTYTELSNVISTDIDESKIPKTIDLSGFEMVLSLEKDKIAKSLQKLINNSPDKVEVFAPEDLNEFKETQYEGIISSKVSVSQLLEYIIQQEILKEWDSFIDDFKAKITQSVNNVNNSIRLLSFILSHSENKNTDEFNKNIDEQKHIINSEINLINSLLQDMEDRHLSILSNASQNFEYYAFIKTASNLKQYIKKDDIKKITKHHISLISRLNNKFIKNYTYLLYAKNKALSIKDELTDNKIKSTSESILDLLEQLSPKTDIYKELPFYYKQLFENNKSNHREFWYGREKELELIKISFNRYNKGHKGAIAVISEPGNGKTFFSDYATHKFLPDNNLYFINPPLSGSLKNKDLEDAIFAGFGLSDVNIDEAFNHLPKESVVIFDDIELWWEKSVNGEKLLNVIFDIIKKYYKKHIFIINVNTFLAKIILSDNELKDLFLSFIYLNKFNAEQIQKIIITRHLAGGLKLNYKNKDLEHISKINLAKLFVKYFKISDGNISSALLLWIGNITKLENKTIFINQPKANISLLETISLDDLIILTQFVLHKNLTINSLSNIVLEPKNKVEEKLGFLIRAGLITKKDNIYKINPYLQSQIIKHLKNKKMI